MAGEELEDRNHTGDIATDSESDPSPIPVIMTSSPQPFQPTNDDSGTTENQDWDSDQNDLSEYIGTPRPLKATFTTPIPSKTMMCRCGHEGEHNPLLDFGTVPCSYCHKHTHLACIETGGAKYLLGHPKFKEHQAKSFECEQCVPGYGSQALRKRIPTDLNRKGKTSPQ